MKLKIIICLISLQSAVLVNGQSERAAIRKTIEKFIVGTEYNYPDSILDAFYSPEAKMFLHTDADTTFIVTAERYASFYTRRAPGTRNQRYSKILSLEQVNQVAYVKMQVDIPSFGNRYYDLFLLKKLEGHWKVVAKVTSAEPLPRKPEELKSVPRKETVISGLNRPWSMAFLSETSVLVAEKDGTILRVDLLSKEKTPLQGLPTDVGRAIKIDTAQHAWGVFPPQAHGQTRTFNTGWFQILLDPDFDQNNYIYISYAAENEKRESTTKVIRGKLNGTRVTDIKTLLLAAPYSHGLFHYGGGMIFGPDKKLYITVGERNLYEHLNPDLPLAQDLQDLRGKIFRLNRDGSAPKDNPDFGSEAPKGLYAWGIRAAQGFTLHPQTKDIWFSEHGTFQGDELNILKPGANYGWPYQTTGGYRSEHYAPMVPDRLIFEDPVFYWDKTVAPTGLSFYTGTEFPLWKGDLLVPGLSKGSLWRMQIEDNKVTAAEELFINDRVRLRKVVQSPRGQLYLLTDEEDGRIIKLVNGD